MPLFNYWPYLDLFKQNLDWLITSMKECLAAVEKYPEDLQEYVNRWLASHPEATTTVQDNSLTVNKFTDDLRLLTVNDYVTPEMFGAKGDGLTDDTAALQQALGSSGRVKLMPGKSYLATAALQIAGNLELDLNGSEIKTSFRHLIYNFDPNAVYYGYSGRGNIYIHGGTITGGSMAFIHARNVLLQDVYFSNCVNDHVIEICACKDFKIDSCMFSGMITQASSRKEYINIDNCKYDNFPHFTDPDSETYDGTVVDGLYITGCSFVNGNTTMESAIGKHGHYDAEYPRLNPAKNIHVLDCVINGATVDAFYLINVDHMTIDGCKILNCESFVTIRDSDNVNVINNEVDGISTQNKISDTNGIYIQMNRLSSAYNDDIYMFYFSGECNDVNYCYNSTINHGPKSALYFFGSDSVITELSVMSNSLVSSNQMSSLATITSGADVRFKQVDNLRIANGINSYTVTTDFNILQFNHLLIYVGAVSDHDYTMLNVVNYGGYFEAGQSFTFPVWHHTSGNINVTVEITDAHTITLTGILARRVIAQKLIG